MRVLNILYVTVLGIDLGGIQREDANNFLSRSPRRRGGSSRGYSKPSSSYSKPSKGISKSTVGKIAAGAGAVYVGGKLASGIGKGIGRGIGGGGMEYEEMEEMGYNNGYRYNTGYGRAVYQPVMSEEDRQEMEEIREEPEEEREGPFNLFGMFG